MNRYSPTPRPIAATIQYNRKEGQVKVKFYVDGKEFAFLMSQDNLDKLLHEEGEHIGYLGIEPTNA